MSCDFLEKCIILIELSIIQKYLANVDWKINFKIRKDIFHLLFSVKNGPSGLFCVRNTPSRFSRLSLVAYAVTLDCCRNVLYLSRHNSGCTFLAWISTKVNVSRDRTKMERAHPTISAEVSRFTLWGRLFINRRIGRRDFHLLINI